MQKISLFCLLLIAFSASAESVTFLQQSQLSIKPTILDFGTIPVGTMEGRIITVTNIGSIPVELSGTGGGTGSSFYSYQNCQGTTLNPSESCQMFYNFTPVTAGPVNVIAAGTWNEQSYHILLKGNATGQESPITISPTSFDFGTVQVGDTKQMSANVTNVGNTSVVMVGVGGGVSEPFEASQNCELVTLGPGESCQLTFSFSPTANGSASAVSEGTWNGQAYQISLTGSGAGTQPNITIAPTSLDFGTVELGDTKMMTVNVTNYSNRSLLMTGAGGAPSGPFNGYQNCNGETLSPGESCQLFYSFNPTVDGPASGVSEGTYNGQSYQISLSGNGTGTLPNITIAPTSLDFGDVKLGSYKVLSVVITNYSDRSLVMTGAGGGLYPPFEVSQNCQGETLNIGKSCLMFYNFTPISTGPVNDISSGTWNSQAFEIQVSGNGVEQEVLFE